MTTNHRLLSVVAFTVLLASCEAPLPTVDASSDEALASSIAEVRESLPSDQRTTFDGLIAERSFGGMLTSAFTSGSVSISAIMQPYDGLTGPEFIAKASAEQAEKEAEKRREELAELDELERKLDAFEAELSKLDNLVVEDSRLVYEETSFTASAELLAKVTNGLSVPIAKIRFEYSLKSPDRAVPWDKGEGWFFIDGGLEPGESRELDGTPEWASMRGFMSAYQITQEHPDAVISIKITDAEGADEDSILKVQPISSFEASKLKELRERYDTELSQGE